MAETGRQKAPSPLVETSWLSERQDNPDVRTVDCSVFMNVTDDGDHKYLSGRAEWEKEHIPGSGFVEVLTDLGSRYSPTVPLMAPLSDFVSAMEPCGIVYGNQVFQYDHSNHAWAACIWWMLSIMDPWPNGTLIPRCRWRQTDR